jgi:hypothetical protein
LVHLTIRPPESDSQSQSYPAPSRDPEKPQKSLDSNSYGSGIRPHFYLSKMVVFSGSKIRPIPESETAKDRHSRQHAGRDGSASTVPA